MAADLIDQYSLACASNRVVSADKMPEKIQCKLCEASFDETERFIKHIRVHKHKSSFECVFRECNIVFKSFEAYKKHLRQRHFRFNKQCSFRCSVSACSFVETSAQLMSKHASKHLNSGQPVFCPFGCQTKKPFKTANSMRIHNMYFHRNGNVKSSSRSEESLVPDRENEEKSTNDDDSLRFCAETVSPNGFSDVTEAMVNIFGTLFLKLLSKNHVTETAVQEIVTALGEAAAAQNSFYESHGSTSGSGIQRGDEGNSSKDVDRTLCNVNIFDVMFGSTGIFRSAYMRKKFFRKHYNFVPAIEISLQKDNEHKDAFYYYVPILDTLTTMLNDPSTYNAVFRNKLKTPGYLTDYDDGLKFKKSLFFTNKTVNIFLYQDAAEVVVNAIGNATSRHKLLCVYMVVGNLDPHLRCKTENVQLVLLCKNKHFAYFGTNCIFRRLIEDIKTLEEDGIVIHGGGFPEKVHGSIFTTMNDNLGAHQIGGLVENFSTSSHFCRTCYMEHRTFQNDCLHQAELRTPQTHSADLQVIKDNPACIPYRGVKTECIFDELKHFRMFNFGAAPCVAHDLFEGWINNDLFLILKRISKEQHITALYFQGRINEVCQKLKLDTKITIDYARKSKNIKAKAVDIWHIVQILPFVLINKSVDYSNPLISMLLLIKNITDIVTSTVVSEAQISLLRSFITEYLELRKSLFDTPLRPKHHFTTHYPWLISWLGPLMTYCTLYCERKHCFFKRALRSTLNFKNVVKFCAEQHQFYQALMSQDNARFDRQFMVSKYVESYAHLPASIKQELDKYDLVSSNAVYAEEALYCGYNYRINDYLFLNHDDFGERFYVIKIVLLIFNQTSEEIIIFGYKYAVVNAPEKGIMELIMDNSETAIAQNITEFIDRTPLKTFVENEKQYLFIKHAIPLI